MASPITSHPLVDACAHLMGPTTYDERKLNCIVDVLPGPATLEDACGEIHTLEALIVEAYASKKEWEGYPLQRRGEQVMDFIVAYRPKDRRELAAKCSMLEALTDDSLWLGIDEDQTIRTMSRDVATTH